MNTVKTYEELIRENEELSLRLEEATETITAIRTGQVDALVVNDESLGHQLYTLKTADQTYRVFIEKMNEGAVTLNEHGVILYSNSMFASMLEIPLSKVVGSTFKSFIPAEYQELFQVLFQNGWVQDTKMELAVRKRDGLVPCQLSVTTLQLDEGRSLSVIITDLTSQKDIENQLKANNKRLEEINSELEASNYDLQQFASVASHDLQEPLRKILIFSNMLKSRHDEDFPAESRIQLEKIVSASLRMRAMISDILNYSRLSTHFDNFEQVNLREVVMEILEDYEILLAEKKVEVAIGDLPEIQANRAQIKQVFQNLISNSIKFSKSDQTPLIEINPQPSTQQATPGSDEDPTCTILISDNGIGFDAAYQERIFSLFERLNTKDKYEGSGIGLAITKKIVDKHNGTIFADSVLGEGARFTIKLPMKQQVKANLNNRNSVSTRSNVHPA
ncbi:sensor histidine kinase [Dyadobacter arcticus]|uniref:histidine kinase n=1 Tax=Dyadobacter arcticus TaxID=1078754 RepID=A0ABX0UN48_9BACT|nr:ATP-binding protein [Dyadobacter arcticus]NIJ54421.1 two-component system CheB/CheR fusion protein [Dyadobacter arcticus]